MIKNRCFHQPIKLKTAEAEILKAIMLHDPDGVSHGELAKIIKKDRKNLRIYTKRLIGRKIIRRESGPHRKIPCNRESLTVGLYIAHTFSETSLRKEFCQMTATLVQDDE